MRIVVLTTLAVLGLAASARAETSTQIAARKPAETLAFFKRALISAGAEEDAKMRRIDDFIPLTSCSKSYDYIGEERDKNSLVGSIAELAYDVVYLRALLRVAGYPNSVWEADLAEYERTNLAALDKFDTLTSEEGSAKAKLAKKLNNYKKSTKGRFKDVIAGQEGCGAGEINVDIRTIPSAQRVQYINVVKYDLCTFQKIDPKGSDCNHWLDYGEKGALMAGRYKIRATWADGTTAFRDLDADSLPEGKNGRYSFSIRKR